jgi:hypothetical protein
MRLYASLLGIGYVALVCSSHVRYSLEPCWSEEGDSWFGASLLARGT